MDEGSATRRIHACRPEHGADLLADLGRAYPASAHRVLGPGWVETRLAPEDADRTPRLPFATQVLPGAIDLAGPSVTTLAAAAFARLAPALAAHPGPWRLHVFASPDGPVRPGRPRLVGEALVELLKKKQRRLLRTLGAPDAAAWLPGEALVQIALAAPDAGFFSACRPGERARLDLVLSPFPGGVVELPPDPRPPSRAYAKVREAWARLGRGVVAGETCVDLGASPGGWTYDALAAGATVIAVDRSPLRDDLMRHPRLRFVRGDAFAFAPDAPVDWLLCDVIAFPERSVELLERWLSRGLCRRFVVTVKFKGAADPAIVGRLDALLARLAPAARALSLTANKNELTAFGAAG
jgi:23S rRNA (cytidine2498-2'-O)-methyltransferase